MDDIPDFPPIEFSAADAVAVQGELRRSLGLGPEPFPLPAFIGMISDEIEQCRAAGRNDAEIAAVIQSATGHEIPVEAIARFYAPPQARHGHGPG